MQKPDYELGPLRAAVVQAHINIGAFQRAITKEEGKVKEYEGHIKEWEEYNKWLKENGNNLRQSK